MVMKVLGINCVNFRAQNDKVRSNSSVPQQLAQNNAISNYSYDYHVKTPQKYTKISENKLDNGLTIYSYKLANGYKVSIIPMEGSPSVVKTYVNVGSMNETQDIKGISHFLEHMAFNGTNGENGHIKLNTGDSFKKVEAIGGWANASTNYAITDYVNSAPLLGEKDLEEQIRVLAAMSEDLKLSDDMIAKEKGPVCSEINMILDDPKTIAMDQTVRTLFNVKNPADELVGGSVKHIENLTRKDVVDYYNKYYTPENTNIVVTGDVDPDEVIQLVAKNFVSKGKKGQAQINRYEEKMFPISNTVRKDFVSDKATSAEIVLGFAGPKNNNAREKVLFDLVAAYLNSYGSGLEKNLKPFNADFLINNDKITTNPNGNQLVYLSTSASNDKVEDVLKTIFETISNRAPITDKEADKIKQKLMRMRELGMEYSISVNDAAGRAVLDDNIEYLTKYNDILNSVTAEEINSAIDKFVDLNKAAITVVHPKTSGVVSFKGTGKRTPINLNSIEEVKLHNNYDIGFYSTNSNNSNINLSLYTDKPYSKKAGVINVLNEIYSMGSKKYTEEEFNHYIDDKNIDIYAKASPAGIDISASSIKDNYKENLKLIEELLYNPRITEENLEKAKELIKDRIKRYQTTAESLYRNHESSQNPYEFSNEEVLREIDSITLDDLKECHKYLVENSKGIITANLSHTNDGAKDDIVNFASKLKPVLPNEFGFIKIFNENEKPKVLTKENSNSQADIKEVFKFKTSNDIKENVTAQIMNSILSNSSIGLFENLREKENLAYSVRSNLAKTGDRGELSLNILTTTDNKSIGVESYDNLQKSIDGFNRQIKALCNGKFNDEDIKSAKVGMKASLLSNEGSSSKLGALEIGLRSKYGIEYENMIFDEIDRVTREDIINMAQKIFASKPVYSIVASKDTLNANKDYIEKLGV